MENYGIEHFDEGAQEATLWVGPDGNDNAAGTYENPLASIQTAIDRLDDEVPIIEPKLVKILPGTYQENLFINTKNLTLRGLGDAFLSNTGEPTISIEDDDPNLPVLTVTNMTRNGWQNFEADGGVDYNFTGTSYSYSGASLDRERRYSQTNMLSSLRFENIGIAHQNGGSLAVDGIQILGAPNPNDNDRGAVATFDCRDCNFFSSNTSPFFAKNAEDFTLAGCNLWFGQDIVFDTCYDINVGPSDTHQTWCRGTVIAAGDAGTTPDEGGVSSFGPGWGIDYQQYEINDLDNLYILDEVQTAVGTSWPNTLTTDPGGTFRHNSSNQLGDPDTPIDVKVGTFDARGSADVHINNLVCKDGNYQGSGNLDVENLHVREGPFTIDSGSGHVIRGGNIEGDLRVEGGTDVELRGVTVDGTIVVEGDNTSLVCDGCHAEQMDVDTGTDNSGISVTLNGGSVMTLNDPNNFVTQNTPDYSG